ncbi:ABC transporter substrate-binding protein [Mycobacterium sp. OTB74]|jgi:peptide/nickel transport system substrate-binding protein|uniref:ABC transporter substrate-binding protein n=1 Tax=Mycobacterium sp. OTB74 TaxID=1853452 RepID=UPI0024747429|nr:ABC transporter substrate-binding protein [Mycobacterium sp. OTB74]MDH6247180.1 peptide/nickel transport system substrate-binding protein [Mycobacterium sp. OTB74]
MPARFGPTAFISAVIVVAGSVLSACGSSDGAVEYVVDGALPTYNTATVVGAASGAPQAFSRVQTGFGFHGPDGQVVADRDFGTVSVVGRAPLILDYKINDNAVYSDGKPVTCDDMVLAWAAQSGQFPAFDAANHAGYADVGVLDCQPGQKKARVTFARDRAFIDYAQLFAATSMMPAHVLDDTLGLGDGGVTKAIQDVDGPTIDRVAQAWNTTWNLDSSTDLKKFPSAGPYKVGSVAKDGSITLVANDKWWGAKPTVVKVTVEPRSADLAGRIKSGKVEVVDVAAGSIGDLSVSDNYTRTDSPSAGIQQLIFAAQGPLADPAARRAVSLCTPRDAVAGIAGAPVSNVRLNPASDDSLTVAENPGDGAQFDNADIDGARAAINRQPLNVRIGYRGPDARLAAVVAAITKSCTAAGVTVQDAASPTVGPQSLRANEIDVLLSGLGGAAGSGSSGSSSMDAYALHSGNGNNLSGYNNDRVDGVIGALAVNADAKEQARLLGEGSPVLWGDLPTLPLYRQQRTLLVAKSIAAVSANPTRWGAGWNMDRWGSK